MADRLCRSVFLRPPTGRPTASEASLTEKPPATAGRSPRCPRWRMQRGGFKEMRAHSAGKTTDTAVSIEPHCRNRQLERTTQTGGPLFRICFRYANCELRCFSAPAGQPSRGAKASRSVRFRASERRKLCGGQSVTTTSRSCSLPLSSASRMSRSANRAASASNSARVRR